MSLYTVAVVAPAVFAASPDVTVPFDAFHVLVLNEDGNAANFVEVSFDGVNVHGKLIPGTMPLIRFERPGAQVWFRRGAGAPVVRVTASATALEADIGGPAGGATNSTDIVEVAGVPVAATETPGTLPVEITDPTWTKVGPVALPDAGLLIKNAAGRVMRYLVTVYTSGTAAFLQLHDKVALPPLTANKAISAVPVPTAAGASPSLVNDAFEALGGLDFVNGLVVTLSVTGSTYTVPVGSVAEVTVWYR